MPHEFSIFDHFIDATDAELTFNVGDRFLLEIIPPVGADFFGNAALYEPGVLCLNGASDPFSNIDAGFTTWVLAGSDPTPELNLTGSCPGLYTVDVANATSGGRVALIFGLREGTTIIPPSFECAGVQLGVSGSVQIATTAVADMNGSVQIQRNAPAVACGGVLQVIDVATCSTSNVVEIQ